MAPTISRQWRGGPSDYAALCDYCDVRYLRSQLKKQANGRLGCVGPGTNGCGVGRDEVTLDKLNADKMKNRYRPPKHLGGRFDQLRTSLEDIFGATLAEYWDARAGVMAGSDGVVASWTGQKHGVVVAPVVWPAPALPYFRASVQAFGGRPAIEVGRAGELFTPVRPATPFLPAGARPYVAMVATFGAGDSQAGCRLSGPGAEVVLQIFRYRQFTDSPPSVAATYMGPSPAASLEIPQAVIGATGAAQLAALDAAGLLELRVGKAKVASSVGDTTAAPIDGLNVYWGTSVTLIVVANEPTAAQIAEFEALARTYAVRLP